jgi:hypothetical protein
VVGKIREELEEPSRPAHPASGRIEEEPATSVLRRQFGPLSGGAEQPRKANAVPPPLRPCRAILAAEGKQLTQATLEEMESNGPRPSNSMSARASPPKSPSAPYTSLQEMEEAVALKTDLGFADDLLPARLFVVATKIGGQAFGADDGSRMVGYCLAIPTLPGGRYISTATCRRSCRIPRQRSQSLAGAEGRCLPAASSSWRTFDPLQVKRLLQHERLVASSAASCAINTASPPACSTRHAHRPLHRRMVAQPSASC